MKYKVRETAPDADKEPVLELWLEADEDGTVALRACKDGDGGNWFIVSLTKCGALKLHGCIPKRLGLNTDDRGRIILENHP